MQRVFKKFFKSQAVVSTILILLFAFVACGGGGSSSSGGGVGGNDVTSSLHVSNTEDFLNAIGDGVIRITVDVNITINENITIPTGTTIVLPDGVTVIMGLGSEITFTDSQILFEDTGDLKGAVDVILETETIEGIEYKKIYTKFGLKKFADLVNGGSATINGILKANVVLEKGGMYTQHFGRFGASERPMDCDYYTIDDEATIWIPIGTYTNTFKGIFDGNGHKVSGLYTTLANANQGLFGRVESSTIQNLTVAGCVVGRYTSGGIAGYMSGGTIKNCINEAIVFTNGGQVAESGVENGDSQRGSVGGIVGEVVGTGNLIELCINKSAAVICANTSKGGRVGGIIGCVETTGITGTVQKCINTGFVDAYQYSGGIVGHNYVNAFKIDQCVNLGLVRAHMPGRAYVGGIVSETNGPVSNCYNRGEVNINVHTAGYNPSSIATTIGGIVSSARGFTATINNCYNTGTLTCHGYTTLITSDYGGIRGYTSAGIGDSVSLVTNSYTTYEPAGGGTSITEENLKSLTITSPGLGDLFIKDEGGINGGFPVLKWQVGQ